MATYVPRIFLGILLLQATLQHAASEDSESVEVNKGVNSGPKLDGEPVGVAQNIKAKHEIENNGRQKRYYDFIDFGFPPHDLGASLSFPSRFNYNKRDESEYTNVHGRERDASLTYVLRFLQKLVDDVKQQPQPRPQVQIPAYIPVLYLPPTMCNCPPSTKPHDTISNVDKNKPNNDNHFTQPPPPPTIAPPTMAPPTIAPPTIAPSNVGTTLNFTDRINLDDPRLNWGQSLGNAINVNSNDSVEGSETDGERPISLDPIDPPELYDVQIPPVEHGSVQAGLEQPTISGSTNNPLSNEKPPANGVEEQQCDAAIVVCCLRTEITFSCFTQNGCPNPLFQSNPCAPQPFLVVLDRIYKKVMRVKNVKG